MDSLYNSSLNCLTYSSKYPIKQIKYILLSNKSPANHTLYTKNGQIAGFLPTPNSLLCGLAHLPSTSGRCRLQYNLVISMKKSARGSSGKKPEAKKQSTLTKQKLTEFVIRAAEAERKLEIVKEMLAQQESFTPASLFYRLDSTRKGYLVERDLQAFLLDQQVELKGCELKLLFGRVNANKAVEAVHVREFQNFILPSQNPRLRYFVMRRPVIIPVPRQPLDQKVQWLATKLFTEIVTQYSKLKDIHQTLLSSFDFDATQIFKSISANQNAITGEDILHYITEFGRQISQEEVGCLLRVIDRRGQGLLYLNDFKYFFATLGLKKEHEIFDELSPIPALKESQEAELKRLLKDRDQTLKDRYKDNKSYVKGMDEDGHHILGYSKYRESSKSPGWLSNSRKARR